MLRSSWDRLGEHGRCRSTRRHPVRFRRFQPGPLPSARSAFACPCSRYKGNCLDDATPTGCTSHLDGQLLAICERQLAEEVPEPTVRTTAPLHLGREMKRI